MFTILADAMYAATLARRGSDIPEHLKTHADRHVSSDARKCADARATINSYRQLW